MKARFPLHAGISLRHLSVAAEAEREQIHAVAEAAVALRVLRRETMRKLNYSLRDFTAHSNNPATIRCATRTRDSTPPFAPPTMRR